MSVVSMVEKNPDRLKDLSEKLRTGRLSLRDYLARTERLFAEREPWVRAFVPEEHRFERLRREMAELESKFQDPHSRPPLYGILVGVKDIFHVEGFPTSAGSHVPPAVLRGPEAKSVTLLKSAGALILGKTVTTEFATRAPGPTCNPHDLEHTPGGSSSGSAAAVVAGLCPLALGTQTGGSMIRPASYCGAVGFKPSYRRIPVDGVIPVSPSLDHVGLFTSDVEGAILAARILCEDWVPADEVGKPILGTPEGPYLEKASEEGLRHFRKTCNRLADAGFEIRKIEMLKDLEEIVKHSKTMMAGEMAWVHRDWFRDYSKYYQEKTAELIREGQAVKSEALELSRVSRSKLRIEILSIMERHNLSALLAPAALGPAPPGLESTGDAIMNRPWTNAGLPVVNIPSGKSKEGLPLGLQMIGSWMKDEALLEVARQVEKCVA